MENGELKIENGYFLCAALRSALKAAAQRGRERWNELFIIKKLTAY
jgi:hypothetical protein